MLAGIMSRADTLRLAAADSAARPRQRRAPRAPSGLHGGTQSRVREDAAPGRGRDSRHRARLHHAPQRPSRPQEGGQSRRGGPGTGDRLVRQAVPNSAQRGHCKRQQGQQPCHPVLGDDEAGSRYLCANTEQVRPGPPEYSLPDRVHPAHGHCQLRSQAHQGSCAPQGHCQNAAATGDIGGGSGGFCTSVGCSTSSSSNSTHRLQHTRRPPAAAARSSSGSSSAGDRPSRCGPACCACIATAGTGVGCRPHPCWSGCCCLAY